MRGHQRCHKRVIELFVVVALIVLNGLFALSELAVVSARKTRLRTMADQGRAGAAKALELAEQPGRFLSTVQIGITLIGILAGAYSGAALSARFQIALEGWGVSARLSEPLAYALVIGAITYFSVIFGELAPKQLALQHAETIACWVARPMALLSQAAAPVIWLLDASTRLVFFVFGVRENSEGAVTEQDIRTMVSEAELAGVIETHERAMISGVLRLGDRAVRGVMTPRTQVDWINVDDPPEKIRQMLMDTPRSRLPVAEGPNDTMIGVAQARDMLAALLKGEPLDMRALMRKPTIAPDTLDALEALALLREAEAPMALVHDEYGHFEGVVTPTDILDAIAGAFRFDDRQHPDAVQRHDGSWLLAGAMPADEMAEHLGLTLPGERDYETVAGFVIAQFNRLPEAAEAVETLGWRFEVVDLDGRRIDKVLATRAPIQR